MGNKEFELVSLLIKELPKYPESHSRGSDFYNMTFNILQEYVRNKFSDVTVDKISLGGFSEIVFPYHRMGNTTSLNLFELDELILFSYYYHSRNIYKNVLDLGANIGLHTYFLSKSGCSVKAYEPDPVHFELLKKNSR